MALKKGSKAPDFTLPATSEKEITLSEHLPCILYFYPKDFTPGCTMEACEFRDEFQEFRNLDINVFGINKDSIPTHEKFKAKHKLPFELISDTMGEVVKRYDAVVPFIKATKRITYLIDKDQNIQAVYDNMFGAEKHIGKMIAALNN